MSRSVLVVLMVFVAFALGCKKRVDEPLVGDERPFTPVPKPMMSPVTDWVTVGGVAVRIDKVSVQRPIVEEKAATAGARWRERELENVVLVVWVQIQNRTQGKKIEYRGFGSTDLRREDLSLADEYGNVYTMLDHETPTRHLRDRTRGVLNPGDKVVTDSLCFARPTDGANTLTLTLPALTGKEDEKYQFELPAVAWKK